MVGKAQQVDDPGTKHPGVEITDYEDQMMWRNLGFVAVGVVVVAILLYFMFGANIIH